MDTDTLTAARQQARQHQQYGGWSFFFALSAHIPYTHTRTRGVSRFALMHSRPSPAPLTSDFLRAVRLARVHCMRISFVENKCRAYSALA